MPRTPGPLALALLAAALVAAPPSRAAAPDSPEGVLGRYLSALKAEQFEDAWALISRAMRRGRDKEVYVKESKAFMAFADVKIFDFTVGQGKVEKDTARVPNVLESQDRFANTLGLTEYELYTLVREDGGWKVDSQLLLEPHEIPKWFPDTAARRGTAPAAASPPAPSPTPSPTPSD